MINPVLCSSCGSKIEFEEGDVIFGEKWYHNRCAKQIKIKIENKIDDT